MPDPLAWVKRADEDPEGLVSMLIVRHTDGVSTEGALHQRKEAEKLLNAAGLEVVGVTTGVGAAQVEAWKAIRAVWGIGDE